MEAIVEGINQVRVHAKWLFRGVGCFRIGMSYVMDYYGLPIADTQPFGISYYHAMQSIRYSTPWLFVRFFLLASMHFC